MLRRRTDVARQRQPAGEAMIRRLIKGLPTVKNANHRVVALLQSTAARSVLATAAVAAFLPATPAGAQTPPATTTETAAADNADEEIVITGSRIVSLQNEVAVPVAVLDDQMIQESGATNVQDFVTQLPSVGQSFGRSNNNFNVTANATSLINLRNLDEARTLVLINGRRSVGYPGSSAVDVNNIPTDMIDRVEVVTGGASAIYGSEAIAGVVNFILRDKFDGIRVRAQTTISDEGDAPREYISLTAGHSFAGDRGHVILNFSYDNDHGLRSKIGLFRRMTFPTAVPSPRRACSASMAAASCRVRRPSRSTAAMR